MRPAHRDAEEAERRQRRFVAGGRDETMPDPERLALVLDDHGAARKTRLGDEPRTFRHEDGHSIAGARSRRARRERELPPSALHDTAQHLAVNDREPFPSVPDHEGTVPAHDPPRRPAPTARDDLPSPTQVGHAARKRAPCCSTRLARCSSLTRRPSPRCRIGSHQRPSSAFRPSGRAGETSHRST
jgi:hypothetical protein